MSRGSPPFAWETLALPTPGCRGVHRDAIDQGPETPSMTEPNETYKPAKLLTPSDVAGLLSVSTRWVRDHSTRRNPKRPSIKPGEMRHFRSEESRRSSTYWWPKLRGSANDRQTALAQGSRCPPRHEPGWAHNHWTRCEPRLPTIRFGGVLRFDRGDIDVLIEAPAVRSH
jgi:hypothetical protein